MDYHSVSVGQLCDQISNLSTQRKPAKARGQSAVNLNSVDKLYQNKKTKGKFSLPCGEVTARELENCFKNDQVRRQLSKPKR